MKTLVIIFLLFYTFYTDAMECPEYDSLIKSYEIDVTPAGTLKYKSTGQKLIDESFHKRLELHKTLADLTYECKSKLKTVFSTMRLREDYIGSLFYQTPQIPAESVDYKKSPAPIIEGQPYPYHLANEKEAFEFKSGDIMITKGISFISSTISSVMSPKAVFSHIVYVHVDSISKKVETMESYIGHGVSLFNINEALKSENVRILVLRLKDQTLSKRAADYMYSRIKKAEIDKKPIPYDYELDFNDNSKLSCEEIGYDALKTVSRNNVVIPEVPSTVNLNNKEFLKRLGLKDGPMMVPADMEVDSRFEIVLDWTDYKVIRDSNRKDAVSGEMFRWMNEHQYVVHNRFRSYAAGFVWATRYVPGLWHILAKFSGIPADFKKDVPSVAITTLESIKTIGRQMLEFVTIKEEEFHRSTGRWMTPFELSAELEKLRKSHLPELEKIFSPTKS